jgi:hypothetical protein
MTLKAARTILHNPRQHSRSRLINAAIWMMEYQGDIRDEDYDAAIVWLY